MLLPQLGNLQPNDPFFSPDDYIVFSVVERIDRASFLAACTPVAARLFKFKSVM